MNTSFKSFVIELCLRNAMRNDLIFLKLLCFVAINVIECRQCMNEYQCNYVLHVKLFSKIIIISTL